MGKKGDKDLLIKLCFILSIKRPRQSTGNRRRNSLHSPKRAKMNPHHQSADPVSVNHFLCSNNRNLTFPVHFPLNLIKSPPRPDNF